MGANAVKAMGANIAVRDCTYDSVHTFTEAGPNTVGMLVENNSTINTWEDEMTSGNGYASYRYGFYADGSSDASRSETMSALGNYFGRSYAEHNIRTNSSWTNLHENEVIQFTSSGAGAKNINSLRANSGDWIYWSNNTVRGGTLVICALADDVDRDGGGDDIATTMPPPSNIVIDSNWVYSIPTAQNGGPHEKVSVKQGVTHVLMRNNIIEQSTGHAIYMSLGARDIRLHYNTVINEDLDVTVNGFDYDGTKGKFLWIQDQPGNYDYEPTTWDDMDYLVREVELVGNLYSAPALTFSTSGDQCIIAVTDSTSFDLTDSDYDPFFKTDHYQIWDNVWADIADGSSNMFRYEGSSKTLSQWNSMWISAWGSGYYDAQYDVTFTGPDRRPYVVVGGSLPIKTGHSVWGMVTDMVGSSRGTAGSWAAGARNASSLMESP